MAAISYVFTIARVAKRLGEDEELLAELAINLDPEDGCLWVMDDTEDGTLAFTELYPSGDYRLWFVLLTP
jgi:hypothetical protein